jgi:predicted secreted protein
MPASFHAMTAVMMLLFLGSAGTQRCSQTSRGPHVEPPIRIELKVGEKHSLTLKGLGAAGYAWSYSLQEGEGVVEVSTDTLNAMPPLGPGDTAPGSYSSDELVTITARRPGRASIRFVQRRPWERDRPPHREQLIEVHVESS